MWYINNNVLSASTYIILCKIKLLYNYKNIIK